ncbi:RHS repeat-associated core domain-containing protein [Saccharothrix obliqua]|uniref:RHS repeat-associated core domain-containing protein n=1 Tax=Saccharothrix obliqua TaxID=2861747 RepID=UPI001C5DD6BA|nr:LamG-like jellyroll fold domain-containing protein [Saccharothrix obliqua]MBW4720714.1 PIN domain-containing protein [Saccharothrix obliqua]
MRRVPISRAWLFLLMVVLLLAPLTTGSRTLFDRIGGLPPGASEAAPEQRSGTADAGRDGSGTRVARDLDDRDQPRPPDAVPDEAGPLPAVWRPDDGQAVVTPHVEQGRTGPAIDPAAVERPGDRTESTQTFDNPDGTRTLRLHTGPANVRRGDQWVPVDLALVEDRGRYRPRTGPLDVRLAHAAADPELVRLAFDDDHVLTYRLDDAADAPAEVSGAAARYRDVRPGADLVLTATRTGVKEDLVLASATATSTFTFTLDTRRLTPRLSGGAVELVDGDRVVATIPAGHADDANGVRTEAVRYALDAVDADTWRLRVELDQAWLREAGRAFPVTLDPTAALFNADSDDNYVRSDKPANHGSVELEVGRVEGKPVSRAYLSFDNALGTLANQYIVGATLNLDNVWSGSCTPRSVSVYEVTDPWQNTWPGAAVGQALATREFAHGDGCGQPAWVSFPLDPKLMTRWTHGTGLPHGFSLRAADETANGGRRFASANSANPPYLDVIYAPQGASFEVTGVTLPTNTRAGKLGARVTNLGADTWNANVDFGFIVKRKDGTHIRTQRGGWRADIGPMQTHTFVDLPIEPLAPDTYDVFLTMFAGGQDFQQLHQVPYARFELKVSNVAPSSNLQQPGSGATVENRTPTLYAEGKDDDNWPGRGLSYKFRICTDTALTQNCQESPDWGAQSWAPDTLRWNTTYYWGVKTYDTVDATPNWVGPLALTTRVPQPQITSHLAGTPDGKQGPGLDPSIGNYTTAVTDARVATVGPDLTITRTYNSLDPRRDTAFGEGWASRLDMRLRKDDDVSGDVVITYPTGRQVRYGRNADASYASPSGSTADLVHHTDTGRYTLRDNSGNRWEFDVLGRLVRIFDPAGLSETLVHDTQDRVATITNDVSGRQLSFTWTGKHVATVTAGDLVWTYTYQGDRLTSACVPGGAPNCTTYTYQDGSHYRSSVLDDSPRAYWRLGETTGDKFANVTARRNGENAGTQHAVLLGAGGALGGTSDKGAAFDGNSSYVTLPSGLTPHTMSLAVELWFKTTAHGTLLSYADQPFPNAASASTPILYVGTDGLLYGGFTVRATDGRRQIVSPSGVADGQWHHAVLSGAIDRQTLYLDGVAVGQLEGLIDHRQQGALTLGAGSGKDWPATNGGAFHFNGSIDEVAVYTHSVGPLAARQHFGARNAIGALTSVLLPQDNRQFAKLTYDDINDRVSTLVDHEGVTWTLDTPQVQDAVRTAVIRGPSSHGEWSYTFDLDNGGRLTGRHHNGASRTYSYNTAGYLSATVDEIGARTEQTTDARGNRLSNKTCRAPGTCNTTYFTYLQSDDPLDPRRDKLASISDARSSGPEDTTYRTSYTYDTAGRLTQTTWPVPAGHTTAPTETNTYESGLLVRTTGRRGQVTTYTYAPNGDLSEVATPDRQRTQYTYDALGRRKTITSANSGGVAYGTTTVEYTPRSQPAKVTEPAVRNPITGVTHTKVTSYRYDGNGNVVETSVSDATGGDATRTTTMTYDAHDRLAATTYQDGGVETQEYADNGLTHVVTDVKGIRWASQYDERGLLLARSASGAGVDPENPAATGLALESHVYDAAGRVRRSVDAIGRITTFTYYDDGLPATVVRENGNVTLEDHTYDPAGHETRRVTTGGITTVNTFDPMGFQTSSTFDPAGVNRSVTFQRDADGNPTRVERRGAADPNRVETATFEYDPASNLTRQHDHLVPGTAFTTAYDYDDRGLQIAVTDRRGLTSERSYDATGALVSVTTPATEVWDAGVRTASFRGTRTLGRNAFGEVTHDRDAAGGVTTSEFDPMGRATAVTLPDYTPPGGAVIRATTRTTYDVAGRAVQVKDPLDRVTTYDYDPYGRVLSVTRPQVGDVPSVARVTYDRVGEPRSVTDPAGGRTLYTYDDLGRRVTSTKVDRSSGQTLYYTTTTGYDQAGNATSVTNPMGAVSTAAYNAAGEVLTAADATSRATTFAYDIVGRQSRTTDPAGLVTTTTYDLLGRPVRLAQAVDGVEKRASTASYDAADALVGTTSAEGRTRTLLRDELGRVVRQDEKVDATKTIVTSFGYDKLGNRSRFVDGKGNVTLYTSTPWGLPASTVDPATAAHPDDRTWTTSYDAAGQAVRLTKPGGVRVDRTFDAQGRVTLETGVGADTEEKSFGYDLAGRITRVGGPTGDSEYRYDDRGNVILTFGAAGTGTYSYNGDDTVATRTDASGTAVFEYDRAGRISSVVDALTGRTVDFGYDAAGRTSLVRDRSVSGWIRRTLAYDGLGRLTSDQVVQSVDSGIPPNTVLGTQYGYDLDDKAVSKTSKDKAGTVDNAYTYDGAGRLTSWTASGTTTDYEWDDAGNRVRAGNDTYTYDERNRLLSGAGATYTYTARGTLATAVENGQTKTPQFDAFDRMTVNGQGNYGYDSLDRLIDRNGKGFQYMALSNEVVSDGTRVISRLPDGTPFADKDAASTAKGKMLFTDQHGDVVARYLGAAVDGLKTYDPFGKVTRSTGETSSLGYQGDWTDGDTVHMAARWYSPGTGRFLSRDDWNLDPSPSAKGNRYQYGDNDPFNNIDPTGHDACDGFIIPPRAGKFLPPWLSIPIDMICNATPTASGCADVLVDANGNPCPGYERCYTGSIRQAGHCPIPKGPNYFEDDGIPQNGNCKYHVGGCAKPGKPGQPGSDLTGPYNPNKKPYTPVFRPPPPPKWYIFTTQPLVRFDPGTTVQPRPPVEDTQPSPDKVEDKGDEYTDESTEVSHDTEKPSTPPPGIPTEQDLPGIALDNNALVYWYSGSDKLREAIEAVVGGQRPVISPQAYYEFVYKKSNSADPDRQKWLQEMLRDRGGRMGLPAREDEVSRIVAEPPGYNKPGMKPADARVYDSARQENLEILTGDKDFCRRLVADQYPVTYIVFGKEMTLPPNMCKL